ncbi:AI-2E family transporter [Pleurocapsales cyanobacterium LEGE 06147]|nr:AI-2E family transporter [Pleurocapsales cyanobacterium LEGE 06147]
MERQGSEEYLKRLLLTVGVVGLFAVLIILIWAIADMLLLLFAGVLLGVVLRTLAKPIARRTPLGDKSSLLIVVLLLLIILAIGGWLFVPEIVNQTEQLVDGVTAAVNRLEQIFSQYGWGERLLEDIFGEDFGQLPIPDDMLTGITGTFTVTFRSLSHILFIVFVGFFVAIDPELYRSGIVSLIPPGGRKRGREVINKVVEGLRAWLLGRVISMIAVGVVAGIGLSILGIPFAFLLGLITGILEFVPIVGPILSAVLPILIAFTIGPMQAVYVAVFYLILQQLEGNILTPIVQQQVVSLPPVLTLTAVLVMGFLFGPIGIIIATPLAVVLFILVRMLYLHDILGTNPRNTNLKKRENKH